MKTSLLTHLSLRPYGQRLLTPMGALWLSSARTLVVLMALSEAIAWGQLGYLFSDGPVRYVTLAFAAVSILIIVWMVDVSLMTMDRSWAEHAKAILGYKTDGRHGRLRLFATVLLRIGLLAASLFITAPYLAQVVFRKDIEQEVVKGATARIETVRDQLRVADSSALATLRVDIVRKREELEREVAGIGRSGRYGVGPAAATISSSITALEQQERAEAARAQRRIAVFDSLARDWSANRGALASEFNVVIASQSILENDRILNELRKRPEHRRTELAIRVFLGLIFSSLLLLKLFEPRSIRWYLSEVLQGEWDRYRAGTFDDMLPVNEQSKNPDAMSPQRFYEFLTRVWVHARNREAAVAGGNATLEQATHSVALLERLRQHVLKEVEALRAEVARAKQVCDHEDKLSADLTSAIATVGDDIKWLNEELNQIDAQASRYDGRSLLNYRSELTAKLSEANEKMRWLTEKAPLEAERHKRARADLKEAIERMRTSENEVQKRDDELRQLRESLAKAASEWVRTQSTMDGPAGAPGHA